MMVKINIIFLFSSFKKLSDESRDALKSIVSYEYASRFDVPETQIEVNLYDGKSMIKEDMMIAFDPYALGILNEGSLYGKLKSTISSRFLEIPEFRELGFNGSICFKNGQDIKELSKSENGNNTEESQKISKKDYEERAKMYQAEEARYTFSRLMVPDATLERLNDALDRIKYEREIFEEWGVYAIMPSPVTALSFYGPPGTGKSFAAEAIANKLGKKIIRTSYADIENKYVGEGPKNVVAIFMAAEEQDAVLFIDEADSLLSKRLVNVSDPSGQAMNSMRSQLLISLEQFHGIVIFATNLVVNYDKAFESRLMNVKFDFPDVSTREKIWRVHLYPDEQNKDGIRLNIPLSEDVDIIELAEKYELCGRDIRNTVVDACVSARSRGMSSVTQQLLEEKAQLCIKSNKDMKASEDYTDSKGRSKIDVSYDVKEKIAEGFNKKLDEK